jgi:2-polyprenyl-3-methyl-5-hydroxy-6-metoxy-1,4-benzoquinol methylase
MTQQHISSENIHNFILLLEKADAEKLPMAPYCRRYLSHLLANKKYYVHIYAHVLRLLLGNSGKAKEEISLVDYGAGNGLLGIFAKHCGFRKVYCCDMSSNFIDAAKVLSLSMEVMLDGFITGDINAANSFFNDKQPPDAIAGTDVIEHIYDLDDFFGGIGSLNKNMVTVFTTASNTDNPFKVRMIKQLQLKDEYEGGSPADRELFGETATPAFFETRKSIIQEAAASLSNEETEKLAAATRGKIKADILKAVEGYKTGKIFPAAPAHPTNTCDPITGSWTERLLTIEEYKNIYSRYGFGLSVHNGFYNSYEGTLKPVLMKLPNIAAAAGIRSIAPFISLAGKPLRQ